MTDVKIAIKDEASARAWLSTIMMLNEDYYQHMTGAADLLIDMENIAEGSIIDDCVDLGSRIREAAKRTYDAMATIENNVLTAINKVKEFSSEASNTISRVRSIFG